MQYLLLLLLLCSNMAFAAFGVGAGSLASDYYGNSQTAIFRRALSGGEDPGAEPDIIAIPEKDTDRYSIRARLNYGTLIFDQVRNRSVFTPGIGDLSTAPLSRTRAIKNQSGFEIAVGYVWSHTTRGEIEYIAQRSLSYKTAANFGGRLSEVTANFKNNMLLFNGYYEFTHLGRLKPYLTYGLGVSDISVRSFIHGRAPFNNSSTTRNLRLAWQLGAGARLILYPPRWSLDLSYRFIQMGNNVRVIPLGGVQVNGRYAFSVVSVGIVYLF